MIEQDDELRKLLRQWEAPQAGPALDARVRTAFRKSRSSRIRKWLPVAAALLLAGGSATFWMGGSHNVSIETRTSVTGFRPLAEGSITVIKAGEKP